jgi:RNA polymerase sigma-70 factor, ECF subfamily
MSRSEIQFPASPATAPAADRLLMQRMRECDTGALDEVIGRYWPPLLGFASRMVSDHALAEDMVQETFLALWERRRQWEPSDSLRSLLYRMLRNRILNEQRNQRSRVRGLERLHRLPQEQSRSPLQYLEAKELEVAVAGAVESLAPRRREVFVLARYQSLSYRSIGEIMDISEQTVANQMSLAMADLRRALGPFLDDLSWKEGLKGKVRER